MKISITLYQTIILTLFIRIINCNPLGCGGFIKSHVQIDFSKVEVKLLTKQGVVKDKITCAPTNGYYFVPIYDKGDYVLELQPPPGWSFTPTSFNLKIDGKNDLCSQGKDINFIFKGFGITGKVESLGSNIGPEGVEVQLTSNSDVRKSITSTEGDFFFTPVYPGNYFLEITDSQWKIFKKKFSVTVTEGNTALPTQSLIIQGYKVSGSIYNEGIPIKDTVIVLCSNNLQQKNVMVDGCDTSPIELNHLKTKQICHVKSNDKGTFVFNTVPYGKYFIIPFYNNEQIIYKPKLIEFTVYHSDVVIEENFEIIGFSVKGRVLKNPSGLAISNAKIILNGQLFTKTNDKGIYILEKIKAGDYKLKAESDGYQFNELQIQITPNIKELPNLLPYSYEVCGEIISDKPQKIGFNLIGSTKFYMTESNSDNGKFCQFLPAGNYDISVIIEGTNKKELQFYPKSLIVNVNYDQVYNIKFSQLKANIRGSIKCITNKDCNDLKVIIRPYDSDTDLNDLTANVIGNSYNFNEIYPGIYDVFLINNKLCFQTEKQQINVNSVYIEIPNFIQIGYKIIFMSTHETDIYYKPFKNLPQKYFKINQGRSTYCLDKSGIYTFTLKGCHIFQSNKLTINTDNESNEYYLNAIKHKNLLTIKTDKYYDNVTVSISIDGNKYKSEPLKYINNDGYIIELYLQDDEKAVIVPQSEMLYFSPPIISINGDSDCIDLGEKFIGTLGTVYKGYIKPPLSGVIVSIEDDDYNNHEIIEAETDLMGFYKFPPLDKFKNYKINAKKDSYVLKGPDENGNFFAHKLAEIHINVLNKNNQSPLTGCLLSLTGGESYRSNLQTDDNGQIIFHSLSPGEYFLRPLMKEYNFQPTSKVISIKEGETVKIQLIGHRIAYSIMGEVISLGGEPEDNIIVIAQGLYNCSHYSEESTTENNGKFRIRGLQPYCTYNVNIKMDYNELQIERSAPKEIIVKIVDEDVNNIKIVAFHSNTNLDLMLRIYAKSLDYYKSVKIKIQRDPNSSIGGGNIIYTNKLDSSTLLFNKDNNYGVIVYIPKLIIDGKLYIVQLESTNNNLKWNIKPQTFIANNSVKYLLFNLNPKQQIVDNELKQISLSTVLFTCIILIIVYKIDKIYDLCKIHIEKYLNEFNINLFKSQEKEFTFDNNEIDQIVQSINAVKRNKQKIKKPL